MIECTTPNRTHVPEMEQSAVNQKPKTRNHREPKLYRYEGTDLYQWYSKTVYSHAEPVGEPFVMREMGAKAPFPFTADDESTIEVSLKEASRYGFGAARELLARMEAHNG